jgi:hypothetical protein
MFEPEMTLAANQLARIVPPPKGEELQMLGETITAQVEHASKPPSGVNHLTLQEKRQAICE